MITSYALLLAMLSGVSNDQVALTRPETLEILDSCPNWSAMSTQTPVGELKAIPEHLAPLMSLSRSELRAVLLDYEKNAGTMGELLRRWGLLLIICRMYFDVDPEVLISATGSGYAYVASVGDSDMALWPFAQSGKELILCGIGLKTVSTGYNFKKEFDAFSKTFQPRQAPFRSKAKSG